MQEVHITCEWDALLSLLHAFEQQFEQVEEVSVLDWGYTYKTVCGYIVLEWDDDEVSQEFIDQLDAESLVLDFSVYSISCSADGPFGIPAYSGW
jgi:hypothetical protein